MNICFVVNKLYDGGTERVVTSLANAMAQNGKNVSILRFECKQDEYDCAPQIQKELIDLNECRIVFATKVLRFLYKSNYDIIIAFDILPNILCSILKIFSSKVVIISERNAPREVQIHFLNRILRFFTYPLADKIVFQTEEALNFYRKRIQKKGVIICNPVKEDLPFRYKTTEKTIFAMGRLVDQKNYPLLIEAASIIHKKHPEYTFVIFGQGRKKHDLEELIKQIGAESYIYLKGYRNDIYNHIVHFDIYLLTSLYEGMPNSLIEAMSMGFPVIASDCPSGGPRCLIDSFKNGILFINNDINSLVEAIQYMIEHDDEKERMGKSAKQIRDKLCISNIANQWLQLMQNCCSRQDL